MTLRLTNAAVRQVPETYKQYLSANNTCIKKTGHLRLKITLKKKKVVERGGYLMFYHQAKCSFIKKKEVYRKNKYGFLLFFLFVLRKRQVFRLEAQTTIKKETEY